MEIRHDKWFIDKINNNLLQMHAIDGVLYSGKTKFQTMEILHSPAYGKILTLDNKIQSSEVDEFIYHESLVHAPMLAHPKPEKTFIAGGGEGATLREMLKYKTVKKAVMVDIDKGVIDISKQYLPDYHAGAFDDARSRLHYVDARKFLEESKERYDVIAIDLSEPVEEGPAYLLYTKEFYQIVMDKLTDDGLISVQAGCGSYLELLNLKSVKKTLESVFPIVNVYQADIPSFGGLWGFTIGSKTIDPSKLTAKEIDKRIKERGLTDLKFYDGQTHEAMFTQPKHIRKALQRGARLITDDNPLYLYESKGL
ncbi:MAG: polyamine aminopropyltransferase [Dehalococcoidales bacterium]|nr:polyamine aminopropyltransferase [Dehalococcoidales bacterium]